MINDEKPIRTTVEEIVKMESEIWEALRIGDPERDSKFLTDDFLGVYPSGFWNKQAHCDQLKNGPLISKYNIAEAQLINLSDKQVLLAYRAHFSWHSKPEENHQMLISSIWREINGEWKNCFSQDTLASD